MVVWWCDMLPFLVLIVVIVVVFDRAQVVRNTEWHASRLNRHK